MSGTKLAMRVGSTDAENGDRWWRRSMVGVSALSLCLGTWTALRPGHTGDEAFSAILADLPLGRWWEVISQQEMNGSAHAVILGLWANTGDSDAWMRVPSIAAMVAALPVVMILARRLTGSATVAVTAGVVLATNPLAIRYSAEARGYSLFLLLSATSTLLLVRFAEQRRRADVLWWAVVTVVLLYTHLFTSLLLVAQAAMVLLHPERRSLIRSGWIGGVVVATGTLPAVMYFLVNETSNIDWIGRPGPRDVLILGRDLVAGSSWVLAAVIGMAVAAGLVSAWRAARAPGDRNGTWPVLVLVLLAVTGPLLAVMISQVEPIVTVKYLMASLPALAILAGLGLARLRSGRRMIAIALIVVLGVSAATSATRPEPGRVVDRLVADGRPGDAVVFDRFALRVAIERSVHTSGAVPAPTSSWPTGAWGELDLVVDHQTELAAALDAFAQSDASRLWLITTPNEDGRRHRRTMLGRLGADPVQRHRVRGALIELYVLDDAQPAG